MAGELYYSYVKRMAVLIVLKQTSYKLELETAAQIGLDAYEKLKYPLKSVEKGESSASQQFVIFEDALTARITSSVARFVKAI